MIRQFILFLFTPLWAYAVAYVQCVGDSLTYGTGASAGSNYVSQMGLNGLYGTLSSNNGVAGLRLNYDPYGVTNCLPYLTNVSAGKRTVVLWIGINDLAAGSDSASNALIANYTNFCKSIRSNDATVKIVGCTLTLDTAFSAAKNNCITNVNYFITNSGLFDYTVDLAGNPALNDPSNLVDTVHFNNWGYARTAEMVRSNLVANGRLVTDIYVDSGSGNDANTLAQAQSTNTPWAHMPGMLDASNNATAYVSMKGDRFVLKGGSTWSFANTSNNLISVQGSDLTIIGGQRLTPPWGTGYPVLNGATSTAVRSGVYALYRSNVVVDGLKIYRTTFDTDPGASGDGRGVNFVYSGNDIIVANCLIDNCGADGIALTPDHGSHSNYTVYGNQIINCARIHIAVTRDDAFANVNIFSNSFGGMGTYNGKYFALNSTNRGSNYLVGDVLTVVQSGASNGTVSVAATNASGAVTSIGLLTRGEGYSININGLPTTGGHGSGCMINQTSIHGDGIMIGANCTNKPSLFTNIKIHHNKFTGTWFATALIYLNNGDGPNSYLQSGGYKALIYDNQLCIDSDGSLSPAILDIVNGWRDVGIYNNTLNATGTNLISQAIYMGYMETNAEVVITNNIISGCENGISASDLKHGYGLEADYNLYFVVHNDHYIWDDTDRYDTLAEVRAAGYEEHGLVVTSAASLGFLQLPNGTDGNGNWHLQTNSPAIGAGVNMASLFTDDCDGVTRPAVAAWTIGTYEGGTNLPVTPRILSVTGSVRTKNVQKK